MKLWHLLVSFFCATAFLTWILGYFVWPWIAAILRANGVRGL